MTQLMLDMALLYRKFPVLQRDPIQRTDVSKVLQELPPISVKRYAESEEFLLPLLQCEKCIATRVGKITRVAKADLPIEFFNMLKGRFIESPPWEGSDLDRGMAAFGQLPEEHVVVSWVLAFVPLCPAEIPSGATMKGQCKELCERFGEFAQSILEGCTAAAAARLRASPEELIALAVSISMDAAALGSAKQYCTRYLGSLVGEHGGASMLACKLLTKNSDVAAWAKYSRSDKQDIAGKVPHSDLSKTKESEWIRRDLILGQSSVENAPFAAEVALAVVNKLFGSKEYKKYVCMARNWEAWDHLPSASEQDDVWKRSAWVVVARLIAYGVIPTHTASLPDVSGLQKLADMNDGKTPIASECNCSGEWRYDNYGNPVLTGFEMATTVGDGLDAFFSIGGSVDQLQFYKAFFAGRHPPDSDAKAPGDVTPSTDAGDTPRAPMSFGDVVARATEDIQFWPQVKRSVECFTLHNKDWVHKDRARCLGAACELARIGSSAEEALDIAQLSLKSRGDGRQLGSFENHLSWALQFLGSGRGMNDLLAAKELAHYIADVDFQGEAGPSRDGDIQYTRFDVAVDWLQFGFPVEALQVEYTFGKHLSKLKDKLTAAFEVNTCVICFQALPKAHCATSGCSKKHDKFHKECITKWFEGGKKTCPLCREAV